MSKRPTRAKAPAHPVQGDAPVIDRENAETLEPVAAEGALPESSDGLMPTEENEALQKRYVFDQKAGISSLDVMEIAMMRMINVFQIVGLIPANLPVEPGALRTVVLGEAHFAALSPQAQKQMKEAPPQPAPVPAVEAVADDTVKH